MSCHAFSGNLEDAAYASLEELQRRTSLQQEIQPTVFQMLDIRAGMPAVLRAWRGQVVFRTERRGRGEVGKTSEKETKALAVLGGKCKAEKEKRERCSILEEYQCKET
jgi:hypothetical protein